ncbi:SdpI family protein [Qipengyuania marisflavi]|uniref:DUF1648 domain-containing protein n=1 Tax=Qipengyuania marisflavi TaxID=2486356 RepID=A0A5S3PA44_9SPHN|nr:SdpI family protein [Qipengyuania marisflavi]TMM50402.1 DUF1648 domain-containing protein [Qipengyuania marisflavi]
MKIRVLVMTSLALAAAMAVFAFVTAARLPADALLPTHWNASGQADDFSPALTALLLPAGLVLFVTAIFAIIPRIEPLQDRLEGSAPVLRAAWVGMLLVAAVIQLTIGLPAYGVTVPVNVIMLGVGALLMLLGNALPKSRPGFFVGIRTPWAIVDTDNWIATHRLGGKLMLLAGAAIIAASLLPISPETTAIIVVAAIAVTVVVPFAYSWWFWRNKRSQA